MERAQGVKHNKGRQANVFERCSETFHPLFVPHSSIIFAAFSGLPPLWLTSSFGAPSSFTNCCSCWIGLASAFKYSHWVFFCANWHLFSWVVNSPIFKSSAWKRDSLCLHHYFGLFQKKSKFRSTNTGAYSGPWALGPCFIGEGSRWSGKNVQSVCGLSAPVYCSILLLPVSFAPNFRIAFLVCATNTLNGQRSSNATLGWPAIPLVVGLGRTKTNENNIYCSCQSQNLAFRKRKPVCATIALPPLLLITIEHK